VIPKSAANKVLKTETCRSSFGLYVHVPFCATTCNFCAFVQAKPDRTKIKNYLEAIETECRYRFRKHPPVPDTVFWGGGTPGLLLPGDLKELGGTLHHHLDLSQLREWTVEMAPATVTPARLQALRELGVNRISMGVQTFCDETLKIMDRFHSVAQVMRAWDWIQQAGFQSCNIDMIIAYPGQTKAALLEDLQKAIELNPDHISTYCLTFEEDTPLYAKLMQGVYKIDREAEADLYQCTWEFLESNGYVQYEISNFAKPGHASIHNSNTWAMQEWIGLGPSASSQYQGKRWTNRYDTDKWCRGYFENQPQFEELTELNLETLLCDAIIFGLRMNTGIDLDALETRFKPLNTSRWEPLFQRLHSEELALRDGSRLRLTLKGRLLADAIAVEVLELAE